MSNCGTMLEFAQLGYVTNRCRPCQV